MTEEFRSFSEEKKSPKILLWDLETGFNVMNLFSLFQPGKHIHYSAISQERYIICGSIKELGVNRVESVQVDPEDPTNDLLVVEWLLSKISDADAIIAHNGDKFDLKFLNTRALYHRFDPLPPIITIDTLKLAKSKFNFNSNRLDYLGHFLGVGEKIKTDTSLWTKALQGDAKAINDMVKYNRQDVRLLEAVYLKLAPFCDSKLNRALFDEDVCPLCGSSNYEKRGYTTKETLIYQRYKCIDCGKWFQGVKSIHRAEVK